MYVRKTAEKINEKIIFLSRRMKEIIALSNVLALIIYRLPA